MNETIDNKPPVWFWVAGVLLLAWGLLGITMYYLEMTMSDEAYLKSYGQAAHDLRDVVPTWSIVGYAVGVWTGLLGTIVLLLRKALASKLYTLSLIGAVFGWIWYVIDARARVMMSENGGWYMMAVVFALCLFSVWFAHMARSRNLLK